MKDWLAIARSGRWFMVRRALASLGIVAVGCWAGCGEDGFTDTPVPGSGGTGQDAGTGGTGGSSAGSGGAAGGAGTGCTADILDCDGDSTNGCETDTSSSPEHCGSCDNPCPGGDNAQASCSQGACGIICDLNFGDCDGDASNGCEVDTGTSVSDCGACGSPCTATNGTPSCSGGVCSIVCEAQFGDCDGDASNGCETSLDTDTTNCGACGRDCQGTTCTAGICEPIVLSTDSNGGDIALDDTHVYFAGSGTVARVPQAGGAVEVVVTGQHSAREVAVDTLHVYWNHIGAAQPVSRAPLASLPATAEELADQMNWTEGLAVSATHAAWSASDQIWMIPTSGGTAQPLTPAPAATRQVALDDSYVYWVTWETDGKVGRVPIAGGAAEELASGQDHCLDVAVDSTHVYWVVQNDGTVMSVPKGGGTVSTLADLQGLPLSVAVDDTHVYWTDGVAGTVMKADKTGGEPVTLATGESSPASIAVDDMSVYWVSFDQDTIKKVTK